MLLRGLFLCLLLTLSKYCYGQFLPNSIGVAYLAGETKAAYTFLVVFPTEVLENSERYLQAKEHTQDTIFYLGNFTFFDRTGQLLTYGQSPTGSFQIIMQPWCDGNGKCLLRPTVEIIVLKEHSKRKIVGLGEVENIACFVLVNRKPSLFKTEQLDLPPSAVIRLRGDNNGDMRPDCAIWSCYDEAGNCKDKPTGHFHFHFRMEGKDYPLLNLKE